MSELITPQEFERSDGVADWRVVASAASARFRTGSFTAGVELVVAIGALADAADSHADVDLRPAAVTVRLPMRDVPGLSERDVELARQISTAARELELPADAAAVQDVHLTIDAVNRPAVLPFWRAVLGYEQVGDEDLVPAHERTSPAAQPDPRRRLGSARPGRGPRRSGPRQRRPPRQR